MSLNKYLSGLTAVCMMAFALSLQAAPVTRASSPLIRPALAAAQAPQVKSYREWKAEKVKTAQIKVIQIKGQIQIQKVGRRAAAGTDPNLARSKSTEAVASQNISIEGLERQLKEEQYDLEVAQDLSVTDYFAGYLTKVSNKKAAFKEVAGKLSPEEVAELMNAYANSVFGADASDLPASATNTSKDSVR